MFNKKKDYFKKKLRGVVNMIWDLEFKKFKSKEIREEVRQEYDTCKARLETLELQIKAQLKDPTKICEIHNPPAGVEAKLKGSNGAVCACEYIEKAMSKDDIERLYDQKVILKKEANNYLAQVKQIDLDIQGSKATNEYPDGAVGVDQQLESLRELKEMIADYIKRV